MSVTPEKLLTRHTILKTDRIEMFHALISSMEGPHQRRVSDSEDVKLEIRSAPLGRIDIGLIYRSVTMTVESARKEYAPYLIQFPLSGQFRLEIDDRVYSVVPGTGAVISPVQRVRRQATPGWTLVFSVAGDLVRSRLIERMGRSVTAPLTFQPFIGTAVREIYDFCLLIVEAVDRRIACRGNPLAEVLETGLVDLLLDLQPHSQGRTLAQSEANVRSDRIRAVTAYVDRNVKQKISVEDLAHVTGCSVRTLQSAFMELCGMTPMEYVRRHRLSMARKLLEESTEGCSVSEIAQRTGFSQLARFSSAYKAAYGESPTDTMRRSMDHAGTETD